MSNRAKAPGIIKSAVYRIEFHSHLPVDDRHNQSIIRVINDILVPIDEVLEAVKVFRIIEGSFELVAQFDAVDPARNRFPFVAREEPRPYIRDYGDLDKGWQT